MKWRLGVRWGLPIGLAVFAVGHLSLAAAQSRDERAVRAAYVYNLLQYVDWPPGKTELVIGVEGESATGAVLQSLLNGRTSGTHPVRVLLSPSAHELEQCSALYLAGGSARDVRRSLDRLKGRTVLTVGESDSFAREGGMVALVNTGTHIQIEVNLDATQLAGLRISSRVLNLATIVRPAQNGGH